jgi:hypothetical protein
MFWAPFTLFRITFRTYVTWPAADQGEGQCGGAVHRSAAEPEAPSEAQMHIRAVMQNRGEPDIS